MNIASLLLGKGISPLGDATQPASDREKKDDVATGLDKALGKDDFLRLLTTQLRYQDPINPMKDQDFIAQMAQFSSLEQVQNLASTMSKFIEEERATNQMARATSLLGRNVEVQGANGSYTGKVDAVRMVDGVPRLVVGDTLFEVSDVTKVLG